MITAEYIEETAGNLKTWKYYIKKKGLLKTKIMVSGIKVEQFFYSPLLLRT